MKETLRALCKNPEPKLVGVTLLLLPFFVNPFAPTMNLQFQAPKLFAVFLLGNLGLALYLGRKIHWYFGLLHLCFSISTLFTGFGEMQLYPFVFWSAAAIFPIWWLSQAESQRDGMLACLTLGGCLVALHAISQWIGLEVLMRDFLVGHFPQLKRFFIYYAEGLPQTTPIAFFGQHTRLGSFLAPMAAGAFAAGWWVPALLMAFGAAITGSSFTLLALAAGGFIGLRWYAENFFDHRLNRRYGYQFHRQFMALCIAVAFFVTNALFALFPRAEFLMSHGRFQLWESTLRAWWESPYPILGYGLGSFYKLYDANFQPAELRAMHGPFGQAHNEIVQAVFETGALGFAAILVGSVLLGVIFYYRWWKRSSFVFAHPKDPPCVEDETRFAMAYLVATLVNAMGNFPLQMAPQYFITVLCLAIVLKDWRDSFRI